MTQYREVDVPPQVQCELLEGFSVRFFKVPSETNPRKSYYIQVVKNSRAGWGNGTAILLCNCKSAQFRQCLAICGTKATCKHSENLRLALAKEG